MARIRPLTTGVISLIKRGLRVGMPLEKIAPLINIKYETLVNYIEKDKDLKDMVESIPLQGALELHEALHTNAVVNMDGSVQKFLAKNILGMKDKIEHEHTEIKINVNYDDSAKELNQDVEDIDDAEIIEGNILENNSDEGLNEFNKTISFIKKSRQ